MNIQKKRVESRAELVEIFGRASEPKIFIEGALSSPNQFTIISIDSCTIGISNHSFGVPMQIEIIEGRAFVLVGHEGQLDCISHEGAKLLWSIKLDSVFFNFQAINDQTVFVVIEETGISAISDQGNKIWNRATEIITHFEINEQQIRCTTIDDFEIRFSSMTGDLL